MKIGIIGAGRIGGGLARQLTGAGHEVKLSFGRRGPGAVYGEGYRAADAQAVVEAVRAGGAIPPAPRYPD